MESCSSGSGYDNSSCLIARTNGVVPVVPKNGYKCDVIDSKPEANCNCSEESVTKFVKDISLPAPSSDIESNDGSCSELASSDLVKTTSDLSKLLSETCLDDKHCVDQNGAECDIDFIVYESELQMPDIMRLITKDLSEPYSIYTYRYFIHNWPKLCFLVRICLFLLFSYADHTVLFLMYRQKTATSVLVLLCVN